ncbi:class I SAM-dependent methyltransferase [Mycolicibacterium sp. Y3]
MPTSWLDTVVRQTRRVSDMPYPHWVSIFLNNPVRRVIGRPGAVIDGLMLGGDERVLEIGPGPGYYSTEIAKRVPHGHLHLFDVQPQMLDKARRAIEGAGCRNVESHSGDAGAGLPFPEDTFDVAFLAAVLGEVPDKEICVRGLARVLRPGGLLVFVEGFGDPDRQSVQSLRELVEPHGFVLQGWEGTTWRDVVRFRLWPPL